MKNKIIILGLIFSAAFSSCTDWLNPKPLDTMVMEDFWKTKDDVESMVYACYEAMTQKNFMHRVILGGEVRSDEVVQGGTGPSESLKELLNVSIQETNSYADWQAFYKVINYCNNVIKYAPGVRERDPDYTEGLLNIDLAEAHTIRALSYFYLARLYKEFPYALEPYTDDTQEFNIPASSGEFVLEEELKLLANVAENGAVRTRGNSFVSSNIAVKNKGRVTKTTVRTLMADIYLWLGKYAECETMCNKVLQDVLTKDEYMYADRNLFSGTELYLWLNENSEGKWASESYRTIFLNQNSTESIFELQFGSSNLYDVDGIDYTAMTEMYGSSAGRRLLNASPKLYEEWGIFDASDLRRTDNLNRLEINNNSGPARIVKYVGEQESATNYSFFSSSSSLNWIFYRLSDIYLMKAEALIEMGESNFPEAIELINVVYSRSNPNKSLDASKYIGIDAMRELLLLERQREFMFEGKRWFDLFRAARKDGTTANVLSKYILRKYDYNADVIQSKLSDMNSFYMPIYDKELTANRKLNQNPYYVKTLQ